MLLFLAVLVYFSLILWYNIYVERSMTCILKKEENRQVVRCSIAVEIPLFTNIDCVEPQRAGISSAYKKTVLNGIKKGVAYSLHVKKITISTPYICNTI